MQSAFSEGAVEAADARVRYWEAGQGPALVHLQPAGAAGLTPAHDLLRRRFRVVVIEMPGPGGSPAALAQVLDALGLDAFNLMGSAAGAPAALALALEAPRRVLALVLEAPAAPDAALERRLPEVAAPTLVLLGTRDDLAPAAARLCAARLLGGHLVLVYDAGAAIGADRPAAFAEVVADFLERHEAFVISRARTVIHP
jgi:pimeloyl-ACP methyl ester carboxylesterase